MRFYLVADKDAFNPVFFGRLRDAITAACDRARQLDSGISLVHSPRGEPWSRARIVAHVDKRCSVALGKRAAQQRVARMRRGRRSR